MNNSIYFSCRDEFTDIARKDLGDFIKNNMEMYLSLVQDRVDAETGRGDSQITLRALDRLHRRLLAMKGICQETDMTKYVVKEFVIDKCLIKFSN